MLDLHPRATTELGCQLGERAAEAQLVEQLRTQLARDPAHLLEHPAHDLLQLRELVPTIIGDRVHEGGEPEQHPGQTLSDLVVQSLRDAESLRLLRLERAPAARHPLMLQPVEHLVERRDELGELAAVPGRQTLAGPQQIDVRHPPGDLFEGLEDPPEEDEVDHHDDDQAHDDDRRLVELDRVADRDRAPEQRRGDEEEQQRVRAEDSPEERYRVRRPATG